MTSFMSGYIEPYGHVWVDHMADTGCVQLSHGEY